MQAVKRASFQSVTTKRSATNCRSGPSIQEVARVLSESNTLTTSMEHPELLRGCSVGAILSGFGSSFKATNLAGQSFGKEEAVKLYKISRQVERLDNFVSHSWRSSRVVKVLALLINSNMVPATIVSIIVATVLLVMRLRRVLRLIEVIALDGITTYKYAPWACFRMH